MRTLNCDVTELLQEWGAWSCTGLGKRSLEVPEYDNAHWINDDIALWIDSAISKLRQADLKKTELDKIRKYKRHSPRYQSIVLYYKERHNLEMLASALRCGTDKAAKILNSAESFIESQLELDKVA